MPVQSAEHAPVAPQQDHRDTDRLWQSVSVRVKDRIGSAKYASWIKPLQFIGIDGGEAQLLAPSRFIKEWVVTHFHDTLLQAFEAEGAAIYSLDIRTDKRLLTQQAEQEVTDEQPDEGAAEMQTLDSIPQILDSRYTFDRFVVGPSNELGYAAAHKIADAQSVVVGSNPLFLYGGVGLGKTHLMQAIAHHIKANQPHRKVMYLSAEKFMYQFIRALRDKDVVSFKQMFRSVDVLLIDDVQFICGKTSTQEEFFHTFNALVDDGKQLILSGDRSPSDLEGMEERIRSRLGWGLVVDINATTYELRLGILESKLEHLGIEVPKEVLEFLAGKITSNVRELEGALNKVIAHAQLTCTTISLEATQNILRDLLRSHEQVISIETIKQLVAEHYGIKLSDMHSSRRARNIARPRQVAMFLCKTMTTHSFPEIGRKFGGKDHTTVLHAVRRITELLESDPELQEDVRIVRGKLA